MFYRKTFGFYEMYPLSKINQFYFKFTVVKKEAQLPSMLVELLHYCAILRIEVQVEFMWMNANRYLLSFIAF